MLEKLSSTRAIPKGLLKIATLQRLLLVLHSFWVHYTHIHGYNLAILWMKAPGWAGSTIPSLETAMLVTSTRGARCWGHEGGKAGMRCARGSAGGSSLRGTERGLERVAVGGGGVVSLTLSRRVQSAFWNCRSSEAERGERSEKIPICNWNTLRPGGLENKPIVEAKRAAIHQQGKKKKKKRRKRSPPKAPLFAKKK